MSEISFRQGHVATWLPPLAEFWAREDGIERFWITVSDAFTEPRKFTAWNQTFIVLPAKEKGRASSFYRADLAAITAALREIRPDLVHAWGTEDVYALAAARSGCPSLLSMQGILTYYIFRARSHPRMMFQAILEFIILRKTRFLTCESEWARPLLQRRAPRAKISCIEYGIHPDFYAAKWAPDPERPVALFVGTLDVRKGIQDAVKAFHAPQLEHCELWVAGIGPLKIKDSQPNIKWLGGLDRTRLLEVLSKAWCLVLPTRADTSPNVVKEARVIGLPVITTRHGGQSDYIKDGVNGFIVECGDIKRLTECLHRLLDNHAYCLERGRADWETDRALFRVESTAQKFSELYRDICRK